MMRGSSKAIRNRPNPRDAEAFGQVLRFEPRQPGKPAREAFTIEPARLLRVDGERGRIAVGLAADLVAMPADPLTDTENLRRIDFVMKNGRVIRGGSALALAH